MCYQNLRGHKVFISLRDNQSVRGFLSEETKECLHVLKTEASEEKLTEYIINKKSINYVCADVKQKASKPKKTDTQERLSAR